MKEKASQADLCVFTHLSAHLEFLSGGKFSVLSIFIHHLYLPASISSYSVSVRLCHFLKKKDEYFMYLRLSSVLTVSLFINQGKECVQRG